MNKYIHPLAQQQIRHPLPTQKQLSTDTDAPSFKEVFSIVKSNVSLTKHAAQRLADRNIHIPQDKWVDISSKMTEAKTKGVTDALIIMEDVALVVNTKENKVITALKQREAQQRIFTNINGTILL